MLYIVVSNERRFSPKICACSRLRSFASLRTCLETEKGSKILSCDIAFFSNPLKKLFGFYRAENDQNLISKNSYRRGLPEERLNELGIYPSRWKVNIKTFSGEIEKSIRNSVHEYNRTNYQLKIIDITSIKNIILVKLFDYLTDFRIFEDEIEVSYNELRNISSKIYRIISKTEVDLNDLKSAGIYLFKTLFRDSNIINIITGKSSTNILINLSDNLSFLPVEFIYDGETFLWIV